jgi:hypothetical protein
MHFSLSGLSLRYRSDCFVVTTGVAKSQHGIACVLDAAHAVHYVDPAILCSARNSSKRHITSAHDMHVRWCACDVLATII